MNEEQDGNQHTSGLDHTLQEFQTASSRFFERASSVLLDAAGGTLFGFIEPSAPFVPKTSLPDGDEDTRKTLVKKPAKIRSEAMNRNKQLLEGAFHGTLHLYVDYAGEFRYLSDAQYRLKDRLNVLKQQIEKKYPMGTWSMLGAGKYKILPEWDPKGRKQIAEQHVPPPPDAPTFGPGTSAADKDEALAKHRMDLKAYEKMLKRAHRIAQDTKDPKRAKEMLEELTEMRKELKDLESDSTKMRTGSVRDPEHDDPHNPQALPRGELVRIDRSLKALKEDKYPGSKTILETLLEAGADVNYTNEDGFTALMYAARNGHTATVKHLLDQQGIDTDAVNHVGRNAMHYAAQFAHKETVELLRKVGRVNRKQRDEFNMTPKDCADLEGKEVLEAKHRTWMEMVYKGDKFKVVPNLLKTDKPHPSALGPVYNLFGIHDPGTIEAPKEWKPGMWRISKIPDPACKIDPMPEERYMGRWASASKKCGPPVKEAKAPADG